MNKGELSSLKKDPLAEQSTDSDDPNYKPENEVHKNVDYIGGDANGDGEKKKNDKTDGGGKENKPSMEDMKKKPPNDPGYKPPKSGAQWVRNPNRKGMEWLDKNGQVWM